jgi:CheY-like chemotaxis protein
MAKEKFPEENHKSQNTPSVLLASDDRQCCDTIRLMLEQAGYEVTSCDNGAEAIGFACWCVFDVIIMDAALKVISCLDAARIIRSNSGNKDTSMVAVVNETQMDGWLELFETFDDYIEKSAVKDTLLDKIGECVRDSRELKAARKSSEIVCKIAADDDYKRKIEELVCELPGFADKMREAFDKNNFQEVQLQVQALKDQAVLAGFENWVEKVADIEKIVHAEEIEKINRKLDELVRMCVKTKLPRLSDGDKEEHIP